MWNQKYFRGCALLYGTQKGHFSIRASLSEPYTVYIYRTAREEARFREAEWDNYNRHGPRGHAQCTIPPRIRALYLKDV